MKRDNVACIVWSSVLAVSVSAAEPESAAVSAKQGKPRPTAESLDHWEWLHTLSLPPRGQAGNYDFLVPPSVFDKAREDLGDLRLRDANGQGIPFALSIRRAEDVQDALKATLFNRATHADRSTEVSVDLGPEPAQHNEVEMTTSGVNFRRRVRIEFSDNNKDWTTPPELDRAELLHFEANQQKVDVRNFHYSANRRRYVHIVALPDQGVATDRPTIESVSVYHSVKVPGLDQTLPVILGYREDVRSEGSPASAWTIGFGGMAVPCAQVSLDVAEESFSRPYRLELDNPDGEARQVLRRGQLRRSAGERGPLVIRCEPEFGAPRCALIRRLRLVITDDRNPPLTLTGVHYTAPARQVLFAASDTLTSPVQLYFGNPDAGPPSYDFAKFLPENLEPAPVRAEFLEAAAQKNPSYHPAPPALTERWPWLVYVILGASSVVLLGILGILGKQALLRHDGERAV